MGIIDKRAFVVAFMALLAYPLVHKRWFCSLKDLPGVQHGLFLTGSGPELTRDRECHCFCVDPATLIRHYSQREASSVGIFVIMVLFLRRQLSATL